MESGVMGTNAQVGPIRLLSVHIEAPAQYRYPTGADATVWLTVLNEGAAPDALVFTTSPYAAAAELRWDRQCDGVAEPVERLPVQPAGTDVGGPADHGAGPFDRYHVRLVDLNREVLAGTTIPVRFVFEHAGAVTVHAYVQPSTAPMPQPSTRCAPGS
jgi:copper(I)-binding protein